MYVFETIPSHLLFNILYNTDAPNVHYTRELIKIDQI